MNYIKANFLNFLIVIGIGLFCYFMIEDNQTTKKKYYDATVSINKLTQAINISNDLNDLTELKKLVKTINEPQKIENTENK